MGDGMAGDLAKGSILRVADAALNDRRHRDAMRLEIDKELAGVTDETGPSVARLLEANVPNLPRSVLRHFREHIFNDEPPGWWPAYPAKDEIVLRGLRAALELAQPTDLDLDSYWVCVGAHFQTIVTRSPREVKVFYLTPPMPMNVFYPSVPVPDDVWIVCNEADARHIVEIAGYPVGDELGEPTGRARPAQELPDLDPGLRSGGVQVVRPKRAGLDGE